ncbi:hypothetical protein MVR94_004957, partial [Salmonella enterica]|nr:hypothetical protein [Salmonella enterica]EJA5087032.1 hypothetical protein [Salmonella enterica]
MDVSEKKFEQWFRAIETGDDDKWELPAYRSPEWNAYLLRRQLALGAWQASRAAIEIELPDPNDDSLLSTWQYRDATHNVLDG